MTEQFDPDLVVDLEPKKKNYESVRITSWPDNFHFTPSFTINCYAVYG